MTKQECQEALIQGKRVNSLASLIEVALDDAAELDREQYIPHSGEWHSHLDGEPMLCTVCLGGMIVAGTFAVSAGVPMGPARLARWKMDDPDETVMCPDEVPGGHERKMAMYALNSARGGSYAGAYRDLGFTIKSETPRDLLTKLPEIYSFASFRTWKEFDQLTALLREVVPVLREIEDGGYLHDFGLFPC